MLAALDVARNLVGQREHQALDFVEALCAFPVFHRCQLLVADSAGLGDRHMLGPFVDRAGEFRGAQDRDLAQLVVELRARQQRVSQPREILKHRVATVGDHPRDVHLARCVAEDFAGLVGSVRFVDVR